MGRKASILAITMIASLVGATGAITALGQETSVAALKARNTSLHNVGWNVTITWDRLQSFLDAHRDIEVIARNRARFTVTAERKDVNDTGWVRCSETRLDQDPVDMRFDVRLIRPGRGTDVQLSPYFLSGDRALPDCRPTNEFAQLLFGAL